MDDSRLVSSMGEEELRVWSCVICRRKKVRCDRRDPCANCVRAKIECHYPVTGRVPRRNKDPTAWKSPAQKQGELMSRLRRLEAVVTELTAQIEEGSQQKTPRGLVAFHGTSNYGTSLIDGTSIEHALAMSVSNAMDTDAQNNGEFDEEFGSLVSQRDGGIQIGKQFWSVFCSEVGHILQAVHDNSTDDSTSKEPADLTNDVPHDQTFAFGATTASGTLDSLSPLPSQALLLWQVFIDRVDPFIKILNLQSTESLMRSLKGSFSTAGRASEALLFSISLAAVLSMDDETVAADLGTEKALLLAKYRLGTEQALGHANFLISRDTTVIQAFVIYLSILPYLGENQLAWSLTGALLRIAESMGLNHEYPKQEVDDVDLHRRLHWQITFINSRGSSDRKQKTSTQETCINGNHIEEVPSYLSSGTIIQDPANLIYFLRRDTWKLARGLKDSGDQDVSSQLLRLQSARLHLETTYNSTFQLNHSIIGFARRMFDLFFANGELELHMRCTGTTNAVAHPALNVAVAIVDAAHALKTERSWIKWHWQLEGHVPWTALRILLLEARKWPTPKDLSPMIQKANVLLESAPEFLRTHPMWKPLLKLCQGLTKTATESDSDSFTQYKCNGSITTDTTPTIDSDVSSIAPGSISEIPELETLREAMDIFADVSCVEDFQDNEAWYRMNTQIHWWP